MKSRKLAACPHCTELISLATQCDRFWLLVYKRGPIPDNKPCVGNCWIWLGHTMTGGYGIYGKKKERIGAHRMAWIFTNGSIPSGMNICHKCDNKICVNPEHLFLGTTLDNVRDMIQKGRRVGHRGETSPSAKLTGVRVERIRNEYTRGGITCKELAKEYGVSISTIRSAIKGRTWKHVPGPIDAS